MIGPYALYVWGWSLLVFSLTLLAPMITAYIFQEMEMFGLFMLIGLVSAFVGGSVVIAFKERKFQNSRREKILVVIALWFLLPLNAALPFYLSGQIPNFIDAIFEATSGLTTTGSTILGDLSAHPESLIFWRSFLQWIGGFATLCTISLFLSPLTGNSRVHSYILIFDEKTGKNDLQILAILKVIFPVYMLLTIACFIALLLCNVKIYDAFCLSFSTVSTGGFLPRDGSLMLFGSNWILLILSLFMILGALNIFWVGRAIKGRELIFYHRREVIWIVSGILLFTLYFYFFARSSYNDHPSAGWIQPLLINFMKASSLVSTTGFVPERHGLENIPLILLILVIIVGGGRFSSAGGLKATRLIAMFHQSLRELKTLIYPHIVRRVRFGHEELDNSIMTSIWSIFTLTIFVICIVALTLSYAGMDIEYAFLASVSALSNAGPVFEHMKSSTDNMTWIWHDVSMPAKVIVSITMVLGRLEIILVLSLLNIRYWRH